VDGQWVFQQPPRERFQIDHGEVTMLKIRLPDSERRVLNEADDQRLEVFQIRFIVTLLVRALAVVQIFHSAKRV
jgi:hypothetical protein